MTVKLEPPKTKIRAYSGNYPMASQYGVMAGTKGWWGEDDKPLGSAFNSDLWEDAGTVNWTKDESGDNYRMSRIPKDRGGVAGSEDVDPFAGKSADVQRAMVKGSPNAVRPSLPQVGPADVKANAAIPAPQKSIAEQQADYIRSRGGRTAAEADSEFESNLRKDYSEATGFDINTAEGRRKSFQAALQRGGHADAMARNLRAGKYAYLDPNTDAGMKARDTAYQKRFSGDDWTGSNPLTGEFKDREGNIWNSERAFDISQRGEYGMVESDSMPSWMGEQPNYAAAADAVRLNGGSPAAAEPSDTEGNPEYGFLGAPANGPDRPPTLDEYTGLFGFPKGYFNNPSSAPQQAAPSPLQASSDAAQGRIRDAFVTGTSQPESSRNSGPVYDEQQREAARETNYVDDVLNQIRTGNEIDNNVRRAAANYRRAQSQSQGMGKVIRPDGTTAYQEIEPEYTTEDYVKRGADMVRDSQITERSMREGFIPAKGATRYTQPIGPALAPAGYRPPQPAQGPRHPTVEFLDTLKAGANRRANAPRQAAEQMRRMDASGTKWNGGIPANKVYGPNKNPPMFPRGWMWDALDRNFGIKNPF